MTSFHHGISKKEPTSGIIPMKDADTSIIALIAFANDADESVFPLNTPTLITSINRALAASGTEGNLRSSLEAIAAITSPTMIVVRIEDPFAGNGFDQSKVIGTTLESGERTGLQALRNAKSLLGIVPKIIVAPDVETESVIQTIGSLCQRFRAYSYVTPRDEFGIMLETKEQVVQLRDRLGFREVELVWPEWISGNIIVGIDGEDKQSGTENPNNPITPKTADKIALYAGQLADYSSWVIYINDLLIELPSNSEYFDIIYAFANHGIAFETNLQTDQSTSIFKNLNPAEQRIRILLPYENSQLFEAISPISLESNTTFKSNYQANPDSEYYEISFVLSERIFKENDLALIPVPTEEDAFVINLRKIGLAYGQKIRMEVLVGIHEYDLVYSMGSIFSFNSFEEYQLSRKVEMYETGEFLDNTIGLNLRVDKWYPKAQCRITNLDGNFTAAAKANIEQAASTNATLICTDNQITFALFGNFRKILYPTVIQPELSQN